MGGLTGLSGLSGLSGLMGVSVPVVEFVNNTGNGSAIFIVGGVETHNLTLGGAVGGSDFATIFVFSNDRTDITVTSITVGGNAMTAHLPVVAVNNIIIRAYSIASGSFGDEAVVIDYACPADGTYGGFVAMQGWLNATSVAQDREDTVVAATAISATLTPADDRSMLFGMIGVDGNEFPDITSPSLSTGSGALGADRVRGARRQPGDTLAATWTSSFDAGIKTLELVI